MIFVQEEEETEGAVDEELSALREQVETLSTSLLTLTQEKSKLESNYIAEKKVLKVRRLQKTDLPSVIGNLVLEMIS